MAFDWSSIAGKVGGGGGGGSDPDPMTTSPSPDGGGLKKKAPMPGGGKGGGGEPKQWESDQPASAGDPNMGGGASPGFQGWEKARAAGKKTSPPLPWDNRPGPTTPSMARVSGGERPWERSGYHALPDPTKTLPDEGVEDSPEVHGMKD